MAGRPLSANQKRFIEEYAADRNAVQAYFRAFGRRTAAGVRRSYKAAQTSAARLLANDIIRAEVEAAAKAHARRCGVSARKVLRELAAVAFLDAADVCGTDPTGATVLRTIADIPPAARRAIQSVRVKRRRIAGGGDETYEVEEVEYKLASKLDALDKLCKHLGLTANGAALEQLLAALGGPTQPGTTRPGQPVVPAARPPRGGTEAPPGDADADIR